MFHSYILFNIPTAHSSSIQHNMFINSIETSAMWCLPLQCKTKCWRVPITMELNVCPTDIGNWDKQLCQFTRNEIKQPCSLHINIGADNFTDMLTHEDYQLLECGTMQSDRNLQTFWSTCCLISRIWWRKQYRYCNKWTLYL